MRRLALVIAMCGLLAACGADSWLGDTAPPPLPGKRISVLAHTQSLKAETDAARDIVLPAPENVPDWPQAGGYPPHAMHHLQLGDRPHEVWSADIGEGNDLRRVLLARPIAAGGAVFAMDAYNKVSAFSLKSGKRLWQRDLAPEDAGDGTYGGGIAYDAGRLYATTGFDQLVALEARTGKVVWRHALPAPVRGAPTVRAGRVLVITVENQTLALSAEDGHELWHHNGLAEAAAMLGGISPAVDGNTVVVAYTSGEVFGLRIENGTAMWNEVLSGVRRTDQVATMTDIRGLPVIFDNRVYVSSNSDQVAAIDLRSGRRLWERDIGSLQTPWIAGDYLYLLSNASELICFEAATGRVLWVTQLQKWDDEEDHSGRIIWSGPVLASDRLIVASSQGMALAVSPYTGRILGRLELPDNITISPIVANGTLIFVTDDGDLVAYR